MTRHALIVQAIASIIRYISMKKSMATEQYLLSYGLAKFDAAMARFDAKIRQAITRSNLDRCHHIMQTNVADNII
jgi:hypothetical protein